LFKLLTLLSQCCALAMHLSQVDGGKLKEGLISVGSKRSVEPDPLDPEIIKRFDNKFSYRDVSMLLNTHRILSVSV
jgi:hypothetical protein